MVFTYFTVLISVGYKFPEGPFASRSQLNHPKMCKNQKYAIPVVHSSPVVYSTVYTLLNVHIYVATSDYQKNS